MSFTKEEAHWNFQPFQLHIDKQVRLLFSMPHSHSFNPLSKEDNGIIITFL